MRADPDFKSLKEHFGEEAMKADMKHVIAAVKQLTDSDLKEFLKKGLYCIAHDSFYFSKNGTCRVLYEHTKLSFSIGTLCVLDKYELNDTDIRIVFEQKKTENANADKSSLQANAKGNVCIKFQSSLEFKWIGEFQAYKYEYQ